jgi:hypothetical protein
MHTQRNIRRALGALFLAIAMSGLAVACGDDTDFETSQIRSDCKRECESFGFFDCVSSANVADCVDGCNRASLSDAEAFAICASGGICEGTDCLERFDITVEAN